MYKTIYDPRHFQHLTKLVSLYLYLYLYLYWWSISHTYNSTGTGLLRSHLNLLLPVVVGDGRLLLDIPLLGVHLHSKDWSIRQARRFDIFTWTAAEILSRQSSSSNSSSSLGPAPRGTSPSCSSSRSLATTVRRVSGRKRTGGPLVAWGGSHPGLVNTLTQQLWVS